jgi:hypothetical protein
MLINENSENSCIFNEDEKKQFIYQIFKVFVVGGPMCQPDTKIAKYLDITKALYKEAVTVYR